MNAIPRVIVPCLLAAAAVPATEQWVRYEGGDGPGRGKRIVLISGDEEYRSEEVMPQLGKILSQRHGFECTVLFAIDPKTGEINPDHLNNIPGLEALDQADLMILSVRFRDLPPEQMKWIDAYLNSGRPVIGIRPTIAGFVIRKHKAYAHYDWHYRGPEKGWHGGFGQTVLGQTWIAHHGAHRGQSTRGLTVPTAKEHPILRGVGDGEIWGATDVYRTPQPVPESWQQLVLGQVLDRAGKRTPDRFFGLRPDDPVTKQTKKNDPMMPLVWLRTYQVPGGKPGTALNSTIGASTDFENAALRRLIVNASYHLCGLDVPAEANVDVVGTYKPTAYGFRSFTKGVKPADHALGQD